MTSDLTRPWTGAVRWSLETLDGETLDNGEEAVTAGPQATTHICTLDFSERMNPDSQREWIFVVELWQGDQRVDLKIAAFVPTKHLSLIDPEIKTTLSRIDGRLTIDIEAQSLARLVEISLEGRDVVFSDNYFDLPAGRVVSVECPYPEGLTLAQVQGALQVRSVYHSTPDPQAALLRAQRAQRAWRGPKAGSRQEKTGSNGETIP